MLLSLINFMYLDYFSLKERPFSISPDPRFLFMSNRYREALTHLTYGVQDGGGFVLLTGEVGTGKTTVCRCLLQQLPENTRLAFVLNPKLNSLELLATICDEFNIDYPENCQSLKILTDKLTEFLLESHKNNLHAVVMIDEAQNLETEVLEQIRLLTNLETNHKKLLQIILVGQPELQEKLARRELRQLAQRITARYHLRPLNLKETIAYIMHRIRIAGSQKNLFSRKAVEFLHAKTQGIPRLVNTICDRALVAAASRQKKQVDLSIIQQATNEVMSAPIDINDEEEKISSKVKYSAIGLLFTLLFLMSYWLGKQSSSVDDKKNIPVKTDTVNSVVKKDNDVTLLEKLLGNESWDYNGRRSFKKLLALWKIEYEPIKNGEACDFAYTFGLKCNSNKGNWQQLRNYNRPALLKFDAGIQGEFWGLLESIDGFYATLVFGEKKSRVKIESLSSLWKGDFILLWQAPVGYNGDIKFGQQGEAVEWLSEKMNQILNTSNQITTVFNNELKNQLIEFQKKHNIAADGIAGMQTILKINSESMQGIPVLLNAQES